MRARVMLFILWSTLWVTLPVPYFMVEIGRMPAAWLSTVAVLVSTSVFSDGAEGSWRIALLFILQALAYSVLLYGLARLIRRALARIPSRPARAVLLGTLLLALWVAALQPIYWSELSNVDPRLSLLEMF